MLLVGVVLLLIPLAAGAWIQSQRSAEAKVLSTVAAQMERGQWETARETLAALRSRRFLSGNARRLAAGFYFRLGEDRSGHELLGAAQFDPDNPEDVRLRELAARCQRAAALVARAEKASSPAGRLKLLREAQVELPESPLLLQRIVREELAEMVGATKSDPAAMARFEEDYTQLRIAAPKLAAELRKEAAALAGKSEE